MGIEELLLDKAEKRGEERGEKRGEEREKKRGEARAKRERERSERRLQKIVSNLVKDTDFDDNKIAALTGASAALVAQVRAKLKEK